MRQRSANGSGSSASSVSCRSLFKFLIFSLFTGKQMLLSIKSISSNSDILIVPIMLMLDTKQSGFCIRVLNNDPPKICKRQTPSTCGKSYFLSLPDHSEHLFLFPKIHNHPGFNGLARY